MTQHVELPITGMTCASCANRIERKLNKLDGVTATVNYATEKATVDFDAAVAPEQLVAAVEAAGYQAVLPASHPLARRSRPLELAELSDESWIGGAPSSAWYRIISHACRLVGFVPEADYASDDYIAVQALVAAGLGVSVIPGLAVRHPLPGVAVRPLAAGAPIRHIAAARPRDAYQGRAVASMLDSLRSAARAFQ